MNCLVIGAGISGFSAARLLAKEHKSIFMIDEKKIDPTDLKKFGLENVEVIQDLALFLSKKTLGLAVVSPGIPKNHLFIQQLELFKVPIVSEIDLALPYFTGKIIGVTGTNGKSTICAMIHHILKKHGQNSLIGGNFGIPLASLAFEEKNPDFLIIELSSYQLEWSNKVKPLISIISNLTHDHLTRHGTMENYLRCKLKMTQHNNEDSLTLIDQSVEMSLKNFGFSLPQGKIIVIDPEKIKDMLDFAFTQKGHNLSNVIFSILATEKILGLNQKSLIKDLADYQKLPYRCEIIKNEQNRLIINDSKSTNVASSLEALKLIQKKCVLLLGGIHKNEPFKPLLKLKNKIHYILAFGASHNYIKEELGSEIQVITFKTLREALLFLEEEKGNLFCDILLSPGGASQDEFLNFEERGLFFTTQINSIFESHIHEQR